MRRLSDQIQSFPFRKGIVCGWKLHIYFQGITIRRVVLNSYYLCYNYIYILLNTFECLIYICKDIYRQCSEYQFSSVVFYVIFSETCPKMSHSSKNSNQTYLYMQKFGVCDMSLRPQRIQVHIEHLKLKKCGFLNIKLPFEVTLTLVLRQG